MNFNKKISMKKIILWGIVGSQLCLGIFGVFLALGRIRQIQNNYFDQLNAVTLQAGMAVDKSISYADYYSVQEYLKKLLLDGKIKDAFLLDEKNQCLVGNYDGPVGCDLGFKNRWNNYRTNKFYKIGKVPFYYKVAGQKRGALQATLILVFDISNFNHIFRQFIVLFLIALVGAGVFLGGLVIWSFGLFSNEILTIKNRITNLYSLNINNLDRNYSYLKFKESQIIEDELEKIQIALKVASEKEVLLEKEKAFSHLAQQVAHDIRSPLAALTVAATQLDGLPEEVRVLIRGAVRRIHDISNDLTARKVTSENGGEIMLAQNELSVQLLSSLVESLVSEKRLQYRSRLDVVIETEFDESSYGLFAKINSREFKRVLSNLVNNSIEAFDDGGKVVLKLFSRDPNICIQICDNGRGIAPDVLPKLMQRGETHGKSDGSGLGLFHAHQMIQSWQGKMTIESALARGTTLTIDLPMHDAPTWFVSSLDLEKNISLAILDDDNSVHQLWRNRLESVAVQNNIKISHFSSPTDFIVWFDREKPKFDKFLLLCDYEFAREQLCGLDVIRELGLASCSVLVTSHFEDAEVLASCIELEIRLLPKNLLGFVPIRAVSFVG